MFVYIVGTAFAGKPDEWIPVEGLKEIFLQPKTSNPTATIVAVRVSGNSMSGDKIFDGDYLVVEMGTHPTPNKLILVRTPHGLVVKRVVRGLDDTIILRSSNPRHKDRAWPNKEIQMVGTVVQIVRDP